MPSRRAGCGGPSKLKRDNPGGYGDDSVADEHQNRSQNTPWYSLGRDVPIPDGSDRNDRPIHSRRNTREAVRFSLELIHQRTYDDDDGEDCKEKNRYLTNTRLQGNLQMRRLTYIFA